MLKVLPYIYFSREFQEDQISIQVKTQSSRLVDPQLEKKVLVGWKELTANAAKNNRKIWDSELYRLENVAVSNHSLKVILSTIPFSRRKMTTVFLPEVLNLGEEYFSKGMFSSIFVKTSDDQYCFLKKSGKYEARNEYSFVGGAYSKTEKIIKNNKDFFDAAKKEIYEEINIVPNDIKNFNLISIFITSQTHVCCLFYCCLDLTLSELRQKYELNYDLESSEIIFLPLNEVNEFLSEKIPGDVIKLELFKRIFH